MYSLNLTSSFLIYMYINLFSQFVKIYATKPFIDIRCTSHLTFISKRFLFHTKKYIWGLKGQIQSYFNVEKYFLKLSKLINVDGEAIIQVLESIEKNKLLFFMLDLVVTYLILSWLSFWGNGSSTMSKLPSLSKNHKNFRD